MRSNAHRMWIATATVVGLLAASLCFAADAPSQDELGRNVKLRILVDKVMQPEEGWVTKEWMIREAAEAGFNVFSPRAGFDKLDEVRDVAQWCRKYGIYHMPWMRGTLGAPVDDTSKGKRVVWASGNEQPLWSVNSDEFWEWTTRYILEYAKISAENNHLMGVFLDYENYATGKEGNLYYLSYDDGIMQMFARDQGLELPELALNERKKWLDDNEFSEKFEELQIAHWRERCRTLREAVDKLNPKFQFCIYPAPGTPFMVKACYPEWSTDAAPIILADPWVYGRPSKFLPQAEALEANKKTLLRGMKIPEEAQIPFIYSGGIDPVVPGADAEFCGKNATMISDVTDGYWIFYEGPKYKVDHPHYFKWFSWANENIEKGNLNAWHEPRVEDENWTLDVFAKAADGVPLAVPQTTGETVTFEPVTLRRENLFVLACKAGQPVQIVLRNRPIGNYQSQLVWDVRDLKMERIVQGKIDHDKEGLAEFTPQADGVYLLGASAGSCAYSPVSSNVPMALLTESGASFIFGVKRLYFAVPAGLKQFTISAQGSGGETVRVNVLDPDGGLAATGQTELQKLDVTITVDVGDNAGKVWALETTKADKGALEDNTIRLGKELAPVLAFTPEHVFGAE